MRYSTTYNSIIIPFESIKLKFKNLFALQVKFEVRIVGIMEMEFSRALESSFTSAAVYNIGPRQGWGEYTNPEYEYEYEYFA